MEEINETGGARIGIFKTSPPFATLMVNRDKLVLKTSIMGTLIFKPSDIITIKPNTGIFRQGIKIVHSVSNYNTNIVFWTIRSPATLIERITETGFIGNVSHGPPDLEGEIAAAIESYGFPIKIPAAITIVVVWNLLYLGDQLNLFRQKLSHHWPGIGAQSALAFYFLICLGLLINEPLRLLILKPRRLDSIKRFLYFIMLITGGMFIAILFLRS